MPSAAPAVRVKERANRALVGDHGITLRALHSLSYFFSRIYNSHKTSKNEAKLAIATAHLLLPPQRLILALEGQLSLGGHREMSIRLPDRKLARQKEMAEIPGDRANSNVQRHCICRATISPACRWTGRITFTCNGRLTRGPALRSSRGSAEEELGMCAWQSGVH